MTVTRVGCFEESFVFINSISNRNVMKYLSTMPTLDTWEHQYGENIFTNIQKTFYSPVRCIPPPQTKFNVCTEFRTLQLLAIATVL